MNVTPVGRNVDEVMRLVQAFQFIDEHGDVCPSNCIDERLKYLVKNMLKKDPDRRPACEDFLAFDFFFV